MASITPDDAMILRDRANPPGWNFRERQDIERHNHIDLKSDQFGGKFGKSIQLSFPRAKLECNVLPFNMAKFTQSFPEFLFERLRIREAERDDAALDAVAAHIILVERPKTLLGAITALAERWLRRRLWMVDFNRLPPSDQGDRVVIDALLARVSF
jgi:hypothetical protein